MAYFAVIFEEDAEKSAHVRGKFTEEHIAWLERNTDTVLLAGALSPGDGGAAHGALWIFKAETAEEVRRILAGDPFYREGLRKSVRIDAWTRGFPKHAVTF
jgi:hypothetical protein